MTDEVIDGQAAEPTDLRSTIMAAVEKQRSPEPETADVTEPVEAEPVEAKPETEAERNERLRDDKGRFAKGEEKPELAKVEPEKVVSVDERTIGGDDKPLLRPPPGWSPTAKVAFDKLPAEVREAVAKREDEINKGFAKLSDYKPLDRYVEMARNSGTTLDKALENYIGIENELSRDMVAGVSRICQNKGVHPVALAKEILARSGVAPSEGQAGETPSHQTAPSVDLSPVMQKISALESFIQQQQEMAVQTELQRFESNPKNQFYENVRVEMGRLMNVGLADSLEEAYDKACRLNPEINALLIKQQAPTVPSANAADAVQRAKAAAKATGGAPSAGFKPNAGTEGSSIRDTIRAAVNQQRGI
jgi:hypothetical protein